MTNYFCKVCNKLLDKTESSLPGLSYDLNCSSCGADYVYFIKGDGINIIKRGLTRVHKRDSDGVKRRH